MNNNKVVGLIFGAGAGLTFGCRFRDFEVKNLIISQIKTIYKMKKITLFVFLFLSLTINAQNIIEKEISGIVTYDNTPLANVTILIKNSKKGNKYKY